MTMHSGRLLRNRIAVESDDVADLQKNSQQARRKYSRPWMTVQTKSWRRCMCDHGRRNHGDDAGMTMETMQAHIDNLMSILKAQP